MVAAIAAHEMQEQQLAVVECDLEEAEHILQQKVVWEEDSSRESLPLAHEATV